ncbi:MAG: hypothetical protein FWH29_05295 [Methanobrevibacter sp.]|nr:hypothetical protein [Methanobrevibacter sp.]
MSDNYDKDIIEDNFIDSNYVEKKEDYFDNDLNNKFPDDKKKKKGFLSKIFRK